MRPLSLVVFGADRRVARAADLRRCGALSPFISLVIYGLSAALIMVDFNYLRKHGTEDDTVWLATGIFVVDRQHLPLAAELFSEVGKAFRPCAR